jgi:hypothetical protein
MMSRSAGWEAVLAALTCVSIPVAQAQVLDIRPAPNGPEKLIAESILARDFDREDCPRVVSAIRLGDGSIRAVCSSGEDFRVFMLNGKTIAMRCSAARQLGAGC